MISRRVYLSFVVLLLSSFLTSFALAEVELVLHYTFDDVNGVTVPDATGTYDGIMEGDAWTLDPNGVFGGGIAMNGNGRVVSDPNVWSDLPGDAVTLTFWLNMDPTAAMPWVGHIFLAGDGGWPPIIDGRFWDDQVVFWPRWGPWRPDPDTLADIGGNWHHYAFVKDGDWKTIYFDGEQVQTANTGNSLDGITEFSIGAALAPGGEPLEGRMDEFCIYNGVLSDMEILIDMAEPGQAVAINSDPNLVLDYPFDEGEGTIVHDARGIYDGMLEGDAWTWDTDGIFDTGSIAFNGNGRVVSDPNVWSDLPGDEVTITTWLNMDIDSAMPWVGHIFLAGDGGWPPIIDGRFWADQVVFWPRWGPWAPDPNTLVELAGNWHHYAFVKDGDWKSIYFDGEQVQTANTGNSLEGITEFSIGAALAPGGEPLEGRMDSFRIFNRALTPAEIRNDMAEPESEWTSEDIGEVAVEGSSDITDGVFTITGSGNIWDPDAFRYVYQKVEGDFEIVASLDDLEAVDEWTKGGLMIGNAPHAKAANAYIYGSPDKGVHMQARLAEGAGPTWLGGPQNAGLVTPVLLKLTKVGNVVTGGFSYDNGVTWDAPRANPSASLALEGDVYAGLAVAVTTPKAGMPTATAVFSNVSITPLEP
ncbi:MAG: LamG domain-containing protein [Planctomycetes bacterium]|nr:LamG domain-containing protein [Planctomycetota bacterium]